MISPSGVIVPGVRRRKAWPGCHSPINVAARRKNGLMKLPQIIDNDRRKMVDVLKALCADHKKISIATGYWDLGAMVELLDELDRLESIRLLIGREPLIPRHKLIAPEGDFPEKDIQFDLEAVSPASDIRVAADRVSAWIDNGKLQVKLVTDEFLHAKTYIFGDFDSDDAIGIIGSSNFTRNGISANLELNSLEQDHRVVTFVPKAEGQETGHLSWFDSIWNGAGVVDWSQRFGEVIESSPVGNKFFSPFEMYMKTLHLLYGEEISEAETLTDSPDTGRTLFDFQIKNTQALLRRLNNYKVAMLSDSVGLGKTTTAINVIKNYVQTDEGRKRVEIICPKSIVQQWEKELTAEHIFGQAPITLQNNREIEQKRELDAIASVSLFVIDESHNLRQTTGVRFQQLLEWIRNNPNAHVLLLTATPINNNLSDLTNQILLGTGGDAEVMKVTVGQSKRQTTQVTFHQAVENLKKKINQDLKRDGSIDFEAIREVMAPIIRTFVVRRTRQGIQREYGDLTIDGETRKFPTVLPGVVEYSFSPENVEAIKAISSESIDLAHVYSLSPDHLINKSRNLSHPYRQAEVMSPVADENELALGSPMFYVFQLILLLGFIPYRWMMYQSKFHGKSREQLGELKIAGDESKKLLLQLGIFGILRTVFLKRMESSVSALRASLDKYQQKLVAFERGVEQGLIVSVSDMNALEASLGDEDLDVDPDLLQEVTLDNLDPKKYDLNALVEDIKLEKELIRILDQQLEVIAGDDSKIKAFASEIDKLRESDPSRKILVFSYFSDTVAFLKENLLKHAKTVSADGTGYLTSANRADAENLASRFSPKSKKYAFKPSESELDLLISTDVLSEGQNLQDSGVLINFDLHWNPVRMIQRNGRVNRLGSVFSEVNVYNMKPESELDGYLKLIQRLQGKIDIIRNTIGTDTPVLDEPENPIEFTDSVSDIYSHDLQVRMDALDQAEQAADFLLVEDEFVMDLKKFVIDPNFDDEYRTKIFSIPSGKWGIFPDDGRKLPATLGLCETIDESGDSLGFQFVEFDPKGQTIRAVPQLQALALLRTSSSDNSRIRDLNKLDRVDAKLRIERGTFAYSDTHETGALVGQQTEVLRIMYSVGYPEEEIDLVRDAFKTKDVFFSRDVDQLKRQLMLKHRKGENYQQELKMFVEKAKLIEKARKRTAEDRPESSTLRLAYMKGSLNA